MMPSPVSGWPVVVLGDAEIGAGGQFQPAAEGVAIEHRDRRLAQAGERIERAVAVAHPVHAEAGGR